VRLPRVGERHDPKDYRAMADQCFQWVHEAKTEDERRAFLKLARAWLQAALDEDAATV
jgi:hypothetical protein